ncbi:MAG: GDP-mannose 4,6-dehydratase [Candidatus Bathyarchaeota archaeon]|nr:GDP-mannose 4,6-dehydratase [Candidatus Bathyarchaeota archaeon]
MERKTCLVTGTSGFIGSRLATALEAKGQNVYCLERYVAGKTIYNKHSIKTVFADLNDHFAIQQIIRTIKPEVVFHVAALSPVAYSYDHPREVLETNYLATVNLAETCMREAYLKHFLFAGTSEEYGNQTVFPIAEHASLFPNSPYSASKVAADMYLKYLHETYEFPVTVLRPFNTYGRTNDTHFLVESVIWQMLNGDTVNLGMEDPIRDLMYVSDHVNAYLACFEQPQQCIGETINFCTGKGWAIPKVAQLSAEILNWKGTINWNTLPKRPNDIMNLTGANAKARQLLGWKPEYELEEGLELTIGALKQQQPEVYDVVKCIPKSNANRSSCR